MALSGNQKTRIGDMGAPGRAYAGFTAKALADIEIWSVTSAAAGSWTVLPTDYDDAKCGIAQCGDKLRDYVFDSTEPPATTWTVQ